MSLVRRSGRCSRSSRRSETSARTVQSHAGHSDETDVSPSFEGNRRGSQALWTEWIRLWIQIRRGTSAGQWRTSEVTRSNFVRLGKIHLTEKGEIHIYSRNSENNTSKYPDVIERIHRAFQPDVNSLILDGECVAYDLEQKKLLPFQTLSTRKRKVTSLFPLPALQSRTIALGCWYQRDQSARSVFVAGRSSVRECLSVRSVCIFAFDLLYLNGQSLIEQPFRERRRLLHQSIRCVPGEIVFAESKSTANIDEINVYLEQSVKDGCEGLMVKTLDDDATYEIAKRSHKWLKVTKRSLRHWTELSSSSWRKIIWTEWATLSIWWSSVVTQAQVSFQKGESRKTFLLLLLLGKRTGVYGGYLLACYDKENEEYQCICKVSVVVDQEENEDGRIVQLGTGFTDELLVSLGESLEGHRIPKPLSYYRYSSSLTPDVWFDTAKVWEVKCADLSLSPHHHAAIGLVRSSPFLSVARLSFFQVDEGKGISLRFPRFLRVREDKSVEDATSAEQVADLYRKQEKIKNVKKENTLGDDDDEMY